MLSFWSTGSSDSDGEEDDARLAVVALEASLAELHAKMPVTETLRGHALIQLEEDLVKLLETADSILVGDSIALRKQRKTLVNAVNRELDDLAALPRQ